MSCLWTQPVLSKAVVPKVGSIERLDFVVQSFGFHNASLSSINPNLQRILVSKNGSIHHLNGIPIK